MAYRKLFLLTLVFVLVLFCISILLRNLCLWFFFLLMYVILLYIEICIGWHTLVKFITVRHFLYKMCVCEVSSILTSCCICLCTPDPFLEILFFFGTILFVLNTLFWKRSFVGNRYFRGHILEHTNSVQDDNGNVRLPKVLIISKCINCRQFKEFLGNFYTAVLYVVKIVF